MSGSRPSGGRTSGPGGLSALRRMSAPGSLAGLSADEADGQVEAAWLPDEPLAEMAERYGLKESAARPPLRDYVRELWQRRHFIMGFATARNVAMYTDARLGQVWQILTPLLNVAVYYLIFGVILNTRRGVPDFLDFLVIGVFVFNFTQRSFIVSSRVMLDSLPLVRALYFPRACLPLGYVLIELQQLAISFVVLFVIVLATPGETLSVYWLLVVPVLVMQTLFNVGCGFILARVGAGFDDVSQLLPFLVRTWFYVSGVMFSIQTFANLRFHRTLSKVLQLNPASIYITLTRNALLTSQRESTPGAKPYDATRCNLFYAHPAVNKYNSAYCHPVISEAHLWLAGAGWAVVALVVGFIFFWRAEVQYGRG
jgi:teichoic acid transport system permease protein